MIRIVPDTNVIVSALVSAACLGPRVSGRLLLTSTCHPEGGTKGPPTKPVIPTPHEPSNAR